MIHRKPMKLRGFFATRFAKTRESRPQSRAEKRSEVTGPTRSVEYFQAQLLRLTRTMFSPPTTLPNLLAEGSRCCRRNNAR